MTKRDDARRLWRPSWAAKLALFGHLIWLTLFSYSLWAKRGTLPNSQPCDGVTDAIAAAAEIGRLDLVALALTFLGVVLAIGAVAGYFMVQHSAMRAASEEARSQVNHLVRPMVHDYMKAEGVIMIAEALQDNPGLLIKAVASARDADQLLDQVSPEDADDIAGSFGGG